MPTTTNSLAVVRSFFLWVFPSEHDTIVTKELLGTLSLDEIVVVLGRPVKAHDGWRVRALTRFGVGWVHNTALKAV